jgi:hypothetical protein
VTATKAQQRHNKTQESHKGADVAVVVSDGEVKELSPSELYLQQPSCSVATVDELQQVVAGRVDGSLQVVANKDCNTVARMSVTTSSDTQRNNAGGSLDPPLLLCAMGKEKKEPGDYWLRLKGEITVYWPIVALLLEIEERGRLAAVRLGVPEPDARGTQCTILPTGRITLTPKVATDEEKRLLKEHRATVLAILTYRPPAPEVRKPAELD